MLGDTAVAVNPSDARYRTDRADLVLPIVEREIPVIADDAVDPEFGTGAVKVTPAHDPTDFEIGQPPQPRADQRDDRGRPDERERRRLRRHGPLRVPRERCWKNCGEEAPRSDEPYSHSVGHCYRCDTVIEPYLSDQWFVRMRPLADAALEAAAAEQGAASTRSAGRRCTSPGWRTSATGASRASSGGDTASRPGTARMQQDHRRAHRPRPLRRVRLEGHPPGRGRARHLVQLRALAVQHRSAGPSHADAETLLPDLRARHRARHHLLLGRADGHDGPEMMGEAPFDDVYIHGTSWTTRAAR